MKKIFLQKTSLLLLAAFLFIGFAAQAQDYVFKTKLGAASNNDQVGASDFAIAANGDILTINRRDIQIFDGTTYAFKAKFSGFDSSPRVAESLGGITVATNGDILVTVNRPGVLSHVQIFDGITYAFKAKFGTFGSGDGQFEYPSGITTAANGDILVLDLFSNNVQVFDGTTYAFKAKFGTFGSGDGQFNAPLGITIATNGDILVTELNSNRVQIFDGITYAFKAQLGTFGFGDGQFYSPRGITTMANGDILVADNNNNRLQIFDGATYAFKSKIGTFGSGDELISGPDAVASTVNGEILVSSSFGPGVKVFWIPVPSINNKAEINDPCACNLDGNGLANGTFAETVTVDGLTSGDTWAVTAIAPLNPGGIAPTGIAINDVLTETPAGSGMYEIIFEHSDLDGYELTVERASDNTQLTISNVCAVPQIALNPAIGGNYRETGADATITLGANLTYGGTAAVGSPTFTLDGTSNITELTFDPTTTDLTIGQVSMGSYNLTARYETDATGSGAGGTLAMPAVPTNACPVELTAAFTSAPPVPTLGQWGLIILSLLMMSLVMAFSAAPKLATTTGQQIPQFSLNNLPFDLNQYAKMWAGTVVSMLAIFTIAIQGFGYELTSADPIGAVVSSFLVAYLVFLAKNDGQ